MSGKNIAYFCALNDDRFLSPKICKSVLQQSFPVYNSFPWSASAATLTTKAALGSITTGTATVFKTTALPVRISS
jgi:hypothetical protein